MGGLTNTTITPQRLHTESNTPVRVSAIDGNAMSQKSQRIARIKFYIETNDVESFRFLNIQKKEYLNLRFNYNMNVL